MTVCSYHVTYAFQSVRLRIKWLWVRVQLQSLKIISISEKPTKKPHDDELESSKANNEIPKERYISPQERQQIIDELRLIQ